MIAKGFVVAMRVTEFSESNSRDEGPHWLILTRWGPAGAMLTVAEAVEVARDQSGNADDIAPSSLHPGGTWLASLDSETPAEGAIFLLARDPPDGFPIAGSFRPAEGFARLEDADGLRLTLAARGLAEAGQPDRTWKLVAVQCPWLGTIIEGS